MAFAAELGALTAELIEVVTSVSHQSDSSHFNVLKESSLRTLRHHTFLRTNQFNVQEQLDGYEDHFRVLNRDGLADALRERLAALSQHSQKWTPEALHLLLQLSDQPVQKSELSSLVLLKEPDEDKAPNLKWDEIARDDGWDQDRDLWRNKRFDEDSSDEDFMDDISDEPFESEVTSLSSLDARYQRQPTDYVEVPQDHAGLDLVHQSQCWRDDSAPADPLGTSQKAVISEIQAVREVLFMLRGLKNSLFDEQCGPSLKFTVKYASWQVYRALLQSFSRAGRQLLLLRSFSNQPQQIPLIQAFRAAIQNRLRLFDKEMSILETQYVDIQQDIVVSLSKTLSEVEPLVRPLACLAGIIRELQQSKHPYTFRYLELLFDAASDAQSIDDQILYASIREIFFECFEVYVRPIRLWMAVGELIDDDKTFFIAKSSAEVPLRQVWTSQYQLRRTRDGVLFAPQFLQPAVSKIFNTGKSVVVLKLLKKWYEAGAHVPEPPLKFPGDLPVDAISFAPFPEIFSDTFEHWMQSKYHAAAATLQRTLFESCGLLAVLKSLKHIYLMSDGSRSNAFAYDIFNNVDLLSSTWHDRFNLTEHANDAFGSLAEPRRLICTVSKDGVVLDVNDVRKSVRLGLTFVKLTYQPSWPTRIILSDESLEQYHSVFTFLLQLKRAHYVLFRHRLMLNVAGDVDLDQPNYYRLRSKLIWFCNTLQTYLTNLVLEPIMNQLYSDLERSPDVDEMIRSHSTLAKRMIDEACLGSKLEPIRDCILDVYDLTIKLHDARQLEQDRKLEEAQELSRLSAMSSSRESLKKRYVQPSEEEDETFLSEQDKSARMQDAEKPYGDILRQIGVDLDRHLKFISGGLRGVARASGDAAASNKWDMLAEMLEVGVQSSL